MPFLQERCRSPHQLGYLRGPQLGSGTLGQTCAVRDAGLGLPVTELGSDSYLLTDPCEVRKVCARRPQEVRRLCFGRASQPRSAQRQPCRSRKTVTELLQRRDREHHTVLDLDWRPMFWAREEQAHAAISPMFDQMTIAVGNRKERKVTVGTEDPEGAADWMLNCRLAAAIVMLRATASWPPPHSYANGSRPTRSRLSAAPDRRCLRRRVRPRPPRGLVTARYRSVRQRHSPHRGRPHDVCRRHGDRSRGRCFPSRA